jgi:hypothetical protein
MPRLYVPPLRRAINRATGFKRLQAIWLHAKTVHGPRSKATENAWRDMVRATTERLRMEVGK